jgi:5-methyltetrahydropteroyltriglutamate--homocysteine methyltransferase
MTSPIPANPAILTTTVGSYPVPAWLAAYPTETAVEDATRVVLSIQQQAGIDLPTDGELYRFDVDHPETNGMIDYFVRPLSGVRADLGRAEWELFRKRSGLSFRAKPAGLVEGPLNDGGLNLLEDCRRIAALSLGAFKFTVTSPYMLAKSLLDQQYGSLEALTMALAEVLAGQVTGLPCSCLQLDEANVTGSPEDGELAAAAINRVLKAFNGERAVHLCFGNYGGQTIQKGTWARLIEFMNRLRVDHLVLESAHRPEAELAFLKEIDSAIQIGLGVIDVKVNHVETADEVASRIDRATRVFGPGRIKYVHPDCGLWMLHRSVADRKIRALVEGRDRFLGLGQ